MCFWRRLSVGIYRGTKKEEFYSVLRDGNGTEMLTDSGGFVIGRDRVVYEEDEVELWFTIMVRGAYEPAWCRTSSVHFAGDKVLYNRRYEHRL